MTASTAPLHRLASGRFAIGVCSVHESERAAGELARAVARVVARVSAHAAGHPVGTLVHPDHGGDEAAAGAVDRAAAEARPLPVAGTLPAIRGVPRDAATDTGDGADAREVAGVR